MPIKTFSTGEVLTASDTNAFLANAGLVYVTGGTLSGTAINILNCFSSSYDDYVLTLDAVSISAAGDIYWQWLNGTTPLTAAAYQWAFRGITVGPADSSGGAVAQTVGYLGITNNGAQIGQKVGFGTYTIFNPMITAAARNPIIGNTSSFPGDWALRNIMTQYNGAVAPRDGIRIMTNSTATMDGVFRLYGYRKA